MDPGVWAEDFNRYIKEIDKVKIVHTFRGKRIIIDFTYGRLTYILKDGSSFAQYRKKYLEQFGEFPPFMNYSQWRTFMAVLKQRAEEA